MTNTNKFWTVMAFIFLYLGVAIQEPLHFSGKNLVSFCMFCVQTEEYIQFREVNHFLRGFLSLSVALIVYARWTRTVAIMAIFAIIYAPLNDLHEYVLTGEYHSIYFIVPVIFRAFSDASVIWFYSTYEMLLMSVGASLAIVSYMLIHKWGNYNPIIVAPTFTLFSLGLSGFSMYLFDQPFQLLTLHNGMLFLLAVIVGLRFLVTKRAK